MNELDDPNKWSERFMAKMTIINKFQEEYQAKQLSEDFLSDLEKELLNSGFHEISSEGRLGKIYNKKHVKNLYVRENRYKDCDFVDLFIVKNKTSIYLEIFVIYFLEYLFYIHKVLLVIHIFFNNHTTHN
mgnify:CR=1 FL=1